MDHRVAVICPTAHRHDRLDRLLRAFDQQTHADRVLLVDDEAPEPFAPLAARAAAEPGRVRYAHAAALPGQRGARPLGARRDALCRLASELGCDTVAQFDDDDYYAPGYLARMLLRLHSRAEGPLDLVKLSAWCAAREADGSLWYVDPTDASPFARHAGWLVRGDGTTFRAPPERSDAARAADAWGYGFSYVFRLAAWARAGGFPRLDFAEDFGFVQALLAAGGRAAAWPDAQGLVLHVLHERSSSLVRAHHRLPGALAARLLGAAAAPWLGAAAADAEPPLLADRPLDARAPGNGCGGC